MKKLFVFLLILGGLATFVAYKTGYLGRGLGAAQVTVSPRDTEILKFFPNDAAFVGIIQVPLAFQMNPPQGEATNRLEAIARDLQEVSGVRLALDVDTVAAADMSFRVARGRFDWDLIADRLAKNGYKITDEGGIPLAFQERSSDTLALMDPYLVHGELEAVKRALSHARNEDGMSERSAIVADLDQIGWRHAGFFAVRLRDEGRSVGEVLSGGGGLRAFGGAIDFKTDHYPLVFMLRPATRSEADKFQAQAEEARQSLLKSLSEEKDKDARALEGAVQAATITSEEGNVLVRFAVPAPLLEGLADGETSPTERAVGESATRIATEAASGFFMKQLMKVAN